MRASTCCRGCWARSGWTPPARTCTWSTCVARAPGPGATWRDQAACWRRSPGCTPAIARESRCRRWITSSTCSSRRARRWRWPNRSRSSAAPGSGRGCDTFARSSRRCQRCERCCWPTSRWRCTATCTPATCSLPGATAPTGWCCWTGRTHASDMGWKTCRRGCCRSGSGNHRRSGGTTRCCAPIALPAVRVRNWTRTIG
jgi:hypothetical protein